MTKLEGLEHDFQKQGAFYQASVTPTHKNMLNMNIISTEKLQTSIVFLLVNILPTYLKLDNSKNVDDIFVLAIGKLFASLYFYCPFFVHKFANKKLSAISVQT